MSTVVRLVAFMGALGLPITALAQHDEHAGHAEPRPRPAEPTPAQAPAPEPAHEHEPGSPPMPVPESAAQPTPADAEDPLAWLDHRTASGTAWQPDHAPAWGWHFMKGSRTTMVHGLAFLDRVDQGGPRGEDDIGLTGWAMVMQRWNMGGRRVGWRGMFSPEAAAWGESGYPQLFQFGEAVDGRLLVDRQHPHDFFMELALTYEHAMGSRRAWHAYLAAAGEPAIGPPAFPHRASAADNPQATLGHHQQDSTHIAFGVATFGVSSRKVRLEASAFNGREPDQERFDFDFGPMDSLAARVSVNPSPAWSLQVSAAKLREPEELKPGIDADRLTASLHHAVPWRDGWVATALIWGRNEEEGEHALTTVTLESTVGRGRSTGYARLERAERAELPSLPPEGRATVSALTLGYVHDVVVGASGHWGLGGHVTFHDVPSQLEDDYGSSPVGFHAFARWRPPPMSAGPSSHAHAGR